MAEVAIPQAIVVQRGGKRSKLKYALQRKSTIAFLMTLPLILLIGALVVYPALYGLHLATLNKAMYWLVVARSSSGISLPMLQ